MAEKARRAPRKPRKPASHDGPLTTRIERRPIEDLRLLEVNARFMRHEMFAQLVENVRRDGVLTSLPFAIRQDDGSYLVVSGNHRVMAAKEAGFEEIDVILSDDPISEERRIAIQLSHNAISGEDDPAVLAQLYESLDADMRAYSGLDDRDLDLLSSVPIPGFREAELDYMAVLISFLPDEAEAAERALTKLKDEATADDRWAARRVDYERFQTLMNDVCDAFHVKNLAVAFGVILTIVERNMDQLAEGWLDEDGDPRNENWWVPISSVIGTDRIPADAAAIIRKSIDRLVSKGDVTRENAWRGLELLAADHLSAK
jgi:hypothetical protein